MALTGDAVEGAEATGMGDNGHGEARPEGSRRRSRGGRGRDRAPREGEARGADDASTSDAQSAGPVTHEARDPAHDALPATAEMGHDAVAGYREPPPMAHRDPEPVMAVAAESAAPAAHIPATTAAPVEVAAAPAQPYALPMDSLVAVAESAGLQWVSSDAAKMRSAQEAMAAVPAEIRVPREIKKPERIDEGALVLVETKKDLSQIKLPFEQNAGGTVKP